MSAQTFAQRVRVAMARTDDNMFSLSGKTGISATRVSQIRSGRSMPSSTELLAMTTALGVSLDWMMTPGPVEFELEDRSVALQREAAIADLKRQILDIVNRRP